MPLVIFGLLVSIPIIVWGSSFVLKLSWIASPSSLPWVPCCWGGLPVLLAISDPVVRPYLVDTGFNHYAAAIGGAVLVLALGTLLAKKAIFSSGLSRDEPVTSGLVVSLGAGAGAGAGWWIWSRRGRLYHRRWPVGAQTKAAVPPPALVADDDDLPYIDAPQNQPMAARSASMQSLNTTQPIPSADEASFSSERTAPQGGLARLQRS